VDPIPFRALRFDLRRAGRLEDLISPPYDVIDPESRRRYGRQTPFNIVHLTLPTGGRRRYRNAAARLDRWCRDGILRYEREPAFYPAVQEFRVDRAGSRQRRGFFAVLGFGDCAVGEVIPHEATFKGPRQDRMRLLEACGADLEPILMLYSDPAGRVEAALEEATGGRALAAFREPQGTRCRLWRLRDPGLIRTIRKGLQGRQVLIADGHHRFASAREYWRRNSGAGGVRPGILAFFCRVEDPGVVSLPTHRLVTGIPAGRLRGLLPALRPRFRIESLPFDSAAAERRARKRVLQTLRDRTGSGFGLRLRGEPAYHLVETAGAGRPGQRTDVERLERLVFGPVLGLTVRSGTKSPHIRYLRDASECLDAVGRGEAQAAFLLRSIPPRRVLSIAKSGRLLPQKSTFFYPKLSSGIVLRRFADPSPR
jgi:uncharacterized protein (DUF1015 family)